MPSTILTSGVVALVSGNVFSGCPYPVGGVTLYFDRFVGSGLPIHVMAGQGSGLGVTMASGGSLSSGGMADGFPMYPGDYLWIPKSKMINFTSDPNQSGRVLSIQVAIPIGLSGSRLWWDYDVQHG